MAFLCHEFVIVTALVVDATFVTVGNLDFLHSKVTQPCWRDFLKSITARKKSGDLKSQGHDHKYSDRYYGPQEAVYYRRLKKNTSAPENFVFALLVSALHDLTPLVKM